MKSRPPEKAKTATDYSRREHWNEMNRKQRREMMRKIQSEDSGWKRSIPTLLALISGSKKDVENGRSTFHGGLRLCSQLREIGGEVSKARVRL